MQPAASETLYFCGHPVTPEELSVIKSVTSDCFALSRSELAHTLCEILEWQRPNGKLKSRECREFLEELSDKSIIRLPAGRITGRPRGSRTSVKAAAEFEVVLNGKKSEFDPVEIVPVSGKEDNARWRAMVDRHHYLGHSVPFGAHIRYFIMVRHPLPVVVGCLQFSSPAWRMEARDRYLGWDDHTRRANLQKIVSNSRFLILPSVRIKNLASSVLSLVSARIASDWEERYRVRPLLLETLVDSGRFSGTCYRAANWITVGQTTGRGRNDSKHLRHGESPKTVFLFPLTKDAVRRLQQA